ncbi:hypothetical protein ACP179_01965 (plasmid) [Xenorhabdus stockiae]|uniref:hypothetical protein n=1 Tax=Xenorhabdus stockiae TaxID=351614 RepID=UPI003CEB9BB0
MSNSLKNSLHKLINSNFPSDDIRHGRGHKAAEVILKFMENEDNSNLNEKHFIKDILYVVAFLHEEGVFNNPYCAKINSYNSVDGSEKGPAAKALLTYFIEKNMENKHMANLALQLIPELINIHSVVDKLPAEDALINVILESYNF